MAAERPRIEVTDVADGGGEGRIAGDRWRQPGVDLPGLQLHTAKDATDGVRRDRLHQAIGNDLACDLGTVPERQPWSATLWQLTGEFGDVECNFRGGKPASVPALADP